MVTPRLRTARVAVMVQPPSITIGGSDRTRCSVRIVKIIGPITEPCVTPHLSECGPDRQSPTLAEVVPSQIGPEPLQRYPPHAVLRLQESDKVGVVYGVECSR